MRQNNFRKHERGMALILSLLALLLISAVGLGLIYMSNTETSINTNYKDTQTAFFAMRAGLEEGRDRLRANSALNLAPYGPALPVPTTFPPAAGSIVYILNPAGATDLVQPTTWGNKYFDDEFCHESFVGSGVTYRAPGTPCTSADIPVGVTTIASQSPNNNTAAALKYKWVRVTLKQNGTTGTPGNVNSYTDSAQPASAQVCWDGTLLKERVASAMGVFTTCAQAKNAGFNVQPVYLITSLAVTPSGSRRVGQYEAGAYMITPPTNALAFDGPGANFNKAPNSNNFGINGYNSGDPANNTGVAPFNTYQPWNGPGGQAACTATTPAVVPAIAVGDAAGANNIQGEIPSNRTSDYTGSTPLPGIPAGPGTPSIQNEGPGTAQYPSTNTLAAGSNWSTPAQLNQLAQSMANVANKTYNCSMNGLPVGAPSCSGTYGSDAAPQITYINGDAEVNGGAGVLVVTGTLTMDGNINFDGLILVIGQGVMNVKGGGGGQVNGSVFIANTNSQTAPYSQLATLGSPTLNWNGGGSNFIQYNSCWADYGSFMQYQLVASREEMY
ncbi:MAG: hypothetical protein ACYDDS_15910 [Candidatus Sulfotelmatobacter sp.]